MVVAGLASTKTGCYVINFYNRECFNAMKLNCYNYLIINYVLYYKLLINIIINQFN